MKTNYFLIPQNLWFLETVRELNRENKKKNVQR